MKRVLIADDEPIMRMDLCDMVREYDYEVVGEAADGFDAVELCRALKPDIVLMDVKMPVFDGLNAAETILAEELAGCVVLLTAFSDADIIARATAAGVAGYLVKPIDQKSLKPTLEVAYAQSVSLRETRAAARAAQQQLRDDRKIRKAQQILAKEGGISETEAYRDMRKLAMDKRITVAELAGRIITQAERSSFVAPVKKLIMEQKGVTDERAYRYISSHAKSHNCSVEEAARELYALMTKGE